MEADEATREADAELVTRLRAGDESAYEALVRRHGPRLLATARRLLRQEEDARDAVQDAFLQSFRGLDRFQGDARLSTWLHRIVVNASLMKLRTRRRKPESPIDDLLPRFREDGHQAEPAAPWRDTAHGRLERRETRDLVRRGIDALPETYRTVLVLRDIEGLDTAETSQALGIGAEAVKTRLHRARQALRQILDPHLRSGSLS